MLQVFPFQLLHKCVYKVDTLIGNAPPQLFWLGNTLESTDCCTMVGHETRLKPASGSPEHRYFYRLQCANVEEASFYIWRANEAGLPDVAVKM